MTSPQPDAPPTPAPPASDAWLSGVRVLDFTQYLAGPTATRMLADLGAEVIKIEQPPYGDPNRGGRPRVNRRAGSHILTNIGKQSLCVDLRSDEGVQIIKEVAAHCDVVVENFSKGVLDRRGLGYDDLAAVNPAIIMASISGFGQTGPLSDRPGFEFIAQAVTGTMYMTGDPDQPPTFVGVAVADTNAGVHAWGAIGHALFRRERTGRGTHLDISLTDCLFTMQETAVHSESMTGGEYGAIRGGLHYPTISPGGSFKGPEGWIVIFCAENQVANLFDALGQPELGSDPRFMGNPARQENRDELTAIIEAWMAGFDTDDEVIGALEQHRVPCGPVLSPAQAMEYPHFVERETVRIIHDPLAGDVAVPGFPIRTTSADPMPRIDPVAPNLGEHNNDILAGLLGRDDVEIARLADAGIIMSKDR